MDDDFAAIHDWAQIFHEPEVLAKTVAKHWVIQKHWIKKDIDQEKADWASGDYFSAGADTADALTRLVGPVE